MDQFCQLENSEKFRWKTLETQRFSWWKRQTLNARDTLLTLFQISQTGNDKYYDSCLRLTFKCYFIFSLFIYSFQLFWIFHLFKLNSISRKKSALWWKLSSNYSFTWQWRFKWSPSGTTRWSVGVQDALSSSVASLKGFKKLMTSDNSSSWGIRSCSTVPRAAITASHWSLIDSSITTWEL